uniref:Uncharacterized protein n=1 Tax=Timema shepardi TaxID=629360 RepID=A0A7R9B5J7_TIMSH|nr:unnamed protein product [Timema shepardi]
MGRIGARSTIKAEVAGKQFTIRPSSHASNMAVFLLVSMCVLLTTAQALDSCPDKPAVSNFNGTAWVGKWYELLVQGPPYSKDAKCQSLELTPSADNSWVSTYSYYSNAASSYATLTSTLTLVDASKNEGKLTFFREGFSNGNTAPFTVLAADYSDFLIAYVCKQTQASRSSDTPQYEEWYFAVSRGKTLSEAAQLKARELLPSGPKLYGDQANCPAA